MGKLIGNKHFYSKVFQVMVPILVQNLITNFVNLLDNLMVGRVGTEPMSGVAIVNQLLFVFNLCIFGGLSGVGIFTAQFYGKGDVEGVQKTIRAKLYFALAATAVFGGSFILFGRELLSLFLHEGADGLSLENTLNYGVGYLRIMLWQMPIFALINAYASSLRETGETRLPMRASIAAVMVNLTFNYILIYGKFGAPALGVEGAAMATVLARIVECTIVICGAHKRKGQNIFADGLYRSLAVPGELTKRIVTTGFPLMINELLWSLGMTTLVQLLSRRGLEVVSADNIASTVSNLFFCVMGAMGSSVAIIIGQLLGAGESEQAVDEDRKLIFSTVVLCTCVGAVMALCSPLIPRLYNTTETVRSLAASMILITAIMLPNTGFINATYFTLRSGGKTWITFLFDCAFVWVVSVPATWFLVEKTALNVLPIYALSYLLDIIKSVVGFIMVKKRIWVNNLVKDE